MREETGTLAGEGSHGLGGRVWAPLITLWIVWGTTYLGTAAMVQSMPPLLGAGARYIVGAAVLAGALALIRGPRVLAIPRRQLRTTAITGIGIIGVWAALVALALQHIPSGMAALVGATLPIWIVLLRMTRGERIGRKTAFGIVIGIVGMGAMLLPGGIASISGESAAVVTFWAGAVVVSTMTYAYFSWRSRTLDLPRNTLVSTAYQLLAGGVVVFLVGLLVGEDVSLTGITEASWAGFWWLVVASAVGYGAYTFLLQHAPVSLVSTFAFVNPLVAVILGWLILGEPFTRGVIIGLVVVVTGTALVVLGEDRSRGG